MSCGNHRPMSRLGDLHEGQGDAGVAVALDLEALDKKAARVAKHLGLDDQHARQDGLDHLHRTASWCNTRSRYWP